MSLGLLGSYYSSSSGSEDEDCDKHVIQKTEESKTLNVQKLANPFMSNASKSLKPSYMVETEDLSAAKQVGYGQNKCITLIISNFIGCQD